GRGKMGLHRRREGEYRQKGVRELKYQPLVQRLFRGSMMAGLALVLLYGVGHAQFFDEKKPIDYEKLFKESLRRNGKFLNLSGKKIGDEGMKHLVGQEWLKKVTKLELRYNKITEQGVRMLAASPSLPNLKTLILRHNFLGDSGAIILAQSKSFRNWDGTRSVMPGLSRSRKRKPFPNCKNWI
ncbi:MAG: hypothetical protein ACE5GQ_11765, partial [Nitrospinales bacterium]